MTRCLLALVLLAIPAAARGETGNEALARGAALARKHDLDGAIAAYERALELKAAPPVTMYNLGCAYALKGQPDEAVEWLKKAAAAGFRNAEAANNDTDLAELRKHKRWPEVAEAFDKAAHPCKGVAVHHQFDFWIGDWDVFAAGGARHVGRSSVQPILGGCVVLENWTGDLGGNGKSFNWYDTAQKHWRQTWVDDTSSSLDYVGDFGDKAMRFAGGTKRLTFYDLPDGKVRQLSEQSTDGGKTWTTQYDFTYVRKQ